MGEMREQARECSRVQGKKAKCEIENNIEGTKEKKNESVNVGLFLIYCWKTPNEFFSISFLLDVFNNLMNFNDIKGVRRQRE